MLTLYAAIRENGIITVKCVNKAKGPYTVIAVISPEKNGNYVLSISQNAVRNGYTALTNLQTLIPPRGTWTALKGTMHGGINQQGTGYFCEMGGFATVEAALKELKSIINPSCTLDTTGNYHGVPWPRTLSSANGTVNWP